MAVLDFLFNGSAPPSVTSSVTSISGLPDWYQEIQRGIVAKGNALAAEPYQGYTGQRIADFTPDQLASFEATRQAQGTGSNLVQQGADLASSAAQPFNQQVFDQFKSPYIEGVVDRIGDLGARNLNEKLLPGINNTFTGGGAFGGDRWADFTGRAVRDTNESVLGQQAIALQQAQDSAMGAYNTAMGRQLTAGQQLGALGQVQQQMGLTDAASLGAIGQQQQQLNQQGLDYGYQQFQEQRDYPKANLGYLNALLRGMEVPTTSTQTTTGPGNNFQPSPLAQLAGSVTGAASLSRILGGS